MYAKKAAYLTSIDSMVGALLSLSCGKCDGNRVVVVYVKKPQSLVDFQENGV